MFLRLGIPIAPWEVNCTLCTQTHLSNRHLVNGYPHKDYKNRKHNTIWSKSCTCVKLRTSWWQRSNSNALLSEPKEEWIWCLTLIQRKSLLMWQPLMLTIPRMAFLEVLVSLLRITRVRSQSLHTRRNGTSIGFCSESLISKFFTSSYKFRVDGAIVLVIFLSGSFPSFQLLLIGFHAISGPTEPRLLMRNVLRPTLFIGFTLWSDMFLGP